MYQALYRKYRPLSFDEVVGQEVIVKTLKNSILNNRLNHAYLFTGPRGTGKTSIAKIFGKTINCENLNGIEPCNMCVNCTQINLKQSVDIIEIDAASNNGVEEIRELKSKVNLVPAVGKYKVYIIDEIHMMTTSAFNALLKTLEEPPTHVIFILATTEPHKIPATILSRCQRFDFKKIIDSKIIERLDYICKEEKISVGEGVLKEIARLSDGGMRDAIGMLDQVLSYADDSITTKEIHEINGTLTQKEIKEFVDALFEHKIEGILNIIENYNEMGKNFVKLSEEIIFYIKNILLYKTIPNYFKKSNEYLEEYKDSANKVKVDELLNLIKEFNQVILDIKNTNNPKLILELISIKLSNVTEAQVDDSKKNEIKEELKNKSKEVENEIKLIETIAKKTEIGDNIDKNLKEALKKVKEIRINNTLANFDKKKLLAFRKELDSIRSLLLDSDYSKMVSIILDGKINAYSDTNLIFVYESEKISDYFNENILNIEKIFKKVYGHEYKAISTCEKEWDKIKKEYNSKEKEYKYIEEDKEIEKILKKTKNEKQDDLKNLFGDLVQYN
ncbi:MAG: DNA polymerase III subunit gamma/tau [Ignavibacteriales bacterium]